MNRTPPMTTAPMTMRMATGETNLRRKLHTGASEKLGLPSSVSIKNINPNADRVYLRVKDDFDLASEKFLNFLKDAYKAFPK